MALAFYGDNSAYEDANIYDWIPRRDQDALPAETRLLGWGLYFVDVEIHKTWATIACVVLFVLFTYGVRIAVSREENHALGMTVSGN
jgi:hypothetical protein